MTASSQPVLRPLGVGELLDQSIRLYRRNFLNFIGIIAVVQIPIGLLTFIIAVFAPAQITTGVPGRSGPALTPGFWTTQLATIVVSIISFILVSGVGTAAMTRVVADNYLGLPTGFADAYRRIGRSWLPLIGTLFLAGFITILLLIWFIVPCVGWLTGLGILAFFGGVVVPLVAPVVVLERKSGYAAIRRGWDLARRRFWRALGFVALLYLFNLIVVSGPNLLIAAAFQGVIQGAIRAGGSAANLLTGQLVIQSLVSLVFSLLYLPLQLIGTTLLYFDLRVRTEGLDLAMLTQAEAASAPDAVLVGQAPPAESVGLVNRRELGSFFLLNLGFFGIYIVLLAVGFALGVALAGAG